NVLRDELGGADGYDALCAAIAKAGMGQLVDFVPNHMGISPQNPWWLDVLENGPASTYAPFFDVDWRTVKHELQHKVLVPVLGDSDPHLQELESILTALEKLATRDEVSPDAVVERSREKEVSKRRLAALFEASPRIAEFVDQNVRIYNGTKGEPRSFDLLDDL